MRVVVSVGMSLVLASSLAACRHNRAGTDVALARPDAAPMGPPNSGPIDPPGGQPGVDAAMPACTAPTPLKQAGETCDCDLQCATGFCQGGQCCGGAACGSRPLGARCDNGNQCDSGSCADGVCCSVECTGGCMSCNQAGNEGECLPVPAGGRDPHDVCKDFGPASCGQSGMCNGQGGCAKYAAGTPCTGGRCMDGVMFEPPSECDGEGVCVAGPPISCAPFGCADNRCRPSCASSGDCIAPAVCMNGSCGKRGKGQDCSNNAECESNFCVDGVCCENACAGRCSFCASVNARGSCVMVRANTLDPRAAMGVRDPARVCLAEDESTCGNDGRCDGQGGCQKWKNGTQCRAGRCDANANTETAAATCQNGTCRVPSARSCAPFRGCSGARCLTQCGSDGQCAEPNTCQDGSCGKAPVGAVCSRDDECAAPGICAQGRCCASACNAPCMACNVAGSLGTCTAVPAGGRDPRNTCRDDACNNGCDGNGGCRREPVGTSCQAATCSGNMLTRHTCNAAGACTPTTTACAMNEVCMNNRCMPAAKQPPGGVCVGNSDCESGACVNGRCCASACAVNACRACNAATGWKCDDRDGQACGMGRVCMGGTCTRKPAGAECTVDGECQSNSCVGGRCCANACAGPPCQACTAANQWRCSNTNDVACGVGGMQVCRDGRCVPRCPPGQIMCDGMCVDPDTNPRHCNGCRISCGDGMCVGGKCTTNPGMCRGNLVECSGMCVNTRNDPKNCGKCGVTCTDPTPRCRAGACVRGGLLPL